MVSRAGRRAQVERQRDVLRDVFLGARHAVLGDEEADLVALGTGVFALGQSLIDLIANPLAHRGALVEAFVISARIQRRGHDENRLRADQRDGGTGRIDQRRGLFLLETALEDELEEPCCPPVELLSEAWARAAGGERPASRHEKSCD